MSDLIERMNDVPLWSGFYDHNSPSNLQSDIGTLGNTSSLNSAYFNILVWMADINRDKISFSDGQHVSGPIYVRDLVVDGTYIFDY